MIMEKLRRGVTYLLLTSCIVARLGTCLQPPAGTYYGVPGFNASYDYVVVGGGLGGLTAATRLAQDGRFSVAVVEAGGFYELENGNHSVVPRYSFNDAPGVDWGFVTTPQPGGLNRSIPYPRGKCLGGSSGRNDMVYHRPTIETMQKWADEVNDQSWTWSNVSVYFNQSATFTSPPAGSRPANATPQYDIEVFGDGPLQVSFPPFSSAIGSWFFDAATQLGSQVRSEGFDSGELLGHSYCALTIDPKNNERSSSETSYLPLGIKSGNLTVYTHSLGKKILFSGTSASGVLVETNGVMYELSAIQEVVLAAGVFQSPQLLMVSGIGPKAVLEQHDIKVVQDLPGVGQNLWDNPLFGPSWPVGVETNSAYANNPQLMLQAIDEYQNNRTGYMTSPGVDVISFEKLSNIPSLNISNTAREQLAQFPDDWPEVEFLSFPSWFGPTLGSPPPNDVQNFGGIVIGLLAPLSRGNVTINSADMSDPPVINPAWLTDPTDQEIAVAAIRRARQYFATPALQNITIGEEAFPGANITSYADILNSVQLQFIPFYHASATCKMGSRNDTLAVVDSTGKVIGVNNLRIADASIFPFLPPGFPQGTVYMVAEKIAAAILAEASE